MKKIGLFFVTIILIVISSWLLLSNNTASPVEQNTSKRDSTSNNTQKTGDIPKEEIIARQLDTPWSIAFLPDESMLVTERKGTIQHVGKDGSKKEVPVTGLEDLLEIGEGGLLGMALHPEFSSNHFLYLYYTYRMSGNNTLNRVVRMTYENDSLSNEIIVVDRIPGAPNHNGGRIKFGPDNFLYIATGDAQEPSRAQDRNSLAGKILRVTEEGKAAPGNPFRNQVFSYGHRNIQGLAFDSADILWATEHGRSGIQSGLDELNLIEAGKNYGWPEIQGDEKRAGMESPVRSSGNVTWAPSGMSYLNNSFFFTGLRGAALYEAKIEGRRVVEFRTHFEDKYGRIRDVVIGPDQMLYLITSNRDGRGSPSEDDDILLRVNPQKL